MRTSVFRNGHAVAGPPLPAPPLPKPNEYPGTETPKAALSVTVYISFAEAPPSEGSEGPRWISIGSLIR